MKIIKNSLVKETTLSVASKNLLIHHLNSFQNNDLKALMSDYTNKSVLVTQAATYRGLNEIEVFFIDLIKHFPSQKASFELDKMEVDDEMVYIVWHANTPSLEVPLGSDTFIIKEGKIYKQTFVGQMKFTD